MRNYCECNIVSYLLNRATSTQTLIIIVVGVVVGIAGVVSTVLGIVSHPIASMLIVTTKIVALILNGREKREIFEFEKQNGHKNNIQIHLLCYHSIPVHLIDLNRVDLVADCYHGYCDDLSDSLEHPYRLSDSCVNADSLEWSNVIHR